jgi:hypothetical protein
LGICPLSLRERARVRDSDFPVIAGVPPPNLLPKGGGTGRKIAISILPQAKPEQKTLCFYICGIIMVYCFIYL